jgi:hypothetical protein
MIRETFPTSRPKYPYLTYFRAYGPTVNTVDSQEATLHVEIPDVFDKDQILTEAMVHNRLPKVYRKKHIICSAKVGLRTLPKPVTSTHVQIIVPWMAKGTCDLAGIAMLLKLQIRGIFAFRHRGGTGRSSLHYCSGGRHRTPGSPN